MLKQAVKDLYKAHDSDQIFKCPDCIKGYGASDRFPWKPNGWSHYAMIHLLFPVLAETPGDILEIGAHEGTFTTILAEFAKTCGKKVIVIDPWNGEQQGGEKQFKTFTGRLGYNDSILVLRKTSQDKDAVELMKGSNICLAWVDGMHKYEYITQDLHNVKYGFKGPGIIGTDDIRGEFGFNAEIFQAVREAADDDWEHMEPPESGIFSFLVKE